MRGGWRVGAYDWVLDAGLWDGVLVGYYRCDDLFFVWCGEDEALGGADYAAGGGCGVGIGGTGGGEGALVDACDFERCNEQAGAFELDLAGGDGVEEHGGGKLDGFGVFEGWELDLVLTRVDACGDEVVFTGAVADLDFVLLPL
jgi:hypothetical protein